jgi:hypothetical protein
MNDEGHNKFFLLILSLTDLYTYIYYRHHTCVENDKQVDHDERVGKWGIETTNGRGTSSERDDE